MGGAAKDLADGQGEMTVEFRQRLFEPLAVNLCLVIVTVGFASESRDAAFLVIGALVLMPTMVWAVLSMRNRKLVVYDSGIVFYSWQGKTVVEASWDQLRWLRTNNSMGSCEPPYLNLRTTMGEVDLFGLANRKEMILMLHNRCPDLKLSEDIRPFERASRK